jgi:Zn-dependent M28 family amino/carboxypeptidase
MYNIIKYLTEIKPARNYKNIKSLDIIAKYIKNIFISYGLLVDFQEFIVDGNKYQNVIATLNPQYNKRLIVGGHYDVCGDIQGADDNASAIAGILETVRQLSISKEDIPFRIDFIAFTLEEPPYFGTDHMGSFVHAKYLKDNNIPVIGMINYEMIGYFTQEPNSQKYPIPQMKEKYPSVGNFIANISNANSKTFLESLDFDNIKKDIDSYDIILPDIFSHITASDHLNYWKMGFAAVMITDTAHFRNPNYHTKNDTIDTIDFKKMQYVIDMVVNAILNMKIV